MKDLSQYVLEHEELMLNEAKTSDINKIRKGSVIYGHVIGKKGIVPMVATNVIRREQEFGYGKTITVEFEKNDVIDAYQFVKLDNDKLPFTIATITDKDNRTILLGISEKVVQTLLNDEYKPKLEYVTGKLKQLQSELEHYQKKQAELMASLNDEIQESLK